MPKEFTVADVQAALDVHVAKGTMEKFDDGTYMLVPRERLTPEQAAWFDLAEAAEQAGGIDRLDRATMLKLINAYVLVASEEQLLEIVACFPPRGQA